MSSKSGDVLGLRALNRAYLARQWLLRREQRSALQAVAHLCGLQAQNPAPPYFALWTRLLDFGPDELSGLLSDRKVVRLVTMRGTIHLLTVDDALAWRPIVQPLLDRDLRTNMSYGRGRLDGLDLDEVKEAGRKLLAERPHTGAQLREALGPRWPDREPAALAHAVRNLLPLIHVPPRGLWRTSGPVAMATAEEWLGRDVDRHARPDAMVLRYLAAFGPATVRDIQAWAGITRLREVVEPLRPRLRTFTGEDGAELFDLPDAPRPDPETTAPPRLVAEFDNLVLSHADRARVIAEGDRKRVFSRPNVFPGMLLLDGFVRGTWKIEDNGDSATVVITPFRRLSESETEAIEDEGVRLLEFAAGQASERAVEISVVDG